MKLKFTSVLSMFAGVLFCGQVHAQLINTFAGTGTSGYSGNGGQATLARLNNCTGTAVDGAGNIYIADRGNNVVRKISTYGIISTFAGDDTAGYSGDGGSAVNARLNQPYAVATDMTGNVYIADFGNNVIRIVNTSGIISTYAGSGTAGYSGDGGVAIAASLLQPEGVAVDESGNVYIADAGNNVVRIVYAADNIISTFAGNGTLGYSGDGSGAVYAQLFSPSSVAVDNSGNVYIADYFNNVIRKVDSVGIISTFAGTGLAGYSGDGGAATLASLHYPSGVSVYQFGNVYISDEYNNVVRVVSPSGVISTFAGTGTNGYRGDGGAADMAELNSPKGVTVDALSRVFIADYGNNVVRMVNASPSTGVKQVAQAGGAFEVYPNPCNGAFTIAWPVAKGIAAITVSDVLGRSVATRDIDGSQAQSELSLGLAPGTYFVHLTEGGDDYGTQVVVVR